ncbi:hypothetical protein HALLA_03295 (plasmid) [Halostagnicola larsenii XH-48]|uniref:Uncharacterized protein n=1 Tax=Halostagnicola larsenii XH-48 TaxID=797299 RepID=W0JRT7_9EURY|nr:hypothetical protein [Halostagnicola larsenii]AHG01426.1 hypothetical protein HALLA_03295 [Halostagnicola larsenii XH-48]
MDGTNRLASLFVESKSNTVLAWIFIVFLVGSVVVGIPLGRYEAALFGLAAIVIVVGPAISLRDPRVMPPWYFLALICLPVFTGTFVPHSLVTSFFPSFALAILGLLLMVELQRFTTLRLVPWFAVVLTVLFTLALAALLTVLRWVADLFFDTSFVLDGRSQNAINTTIMVEFIHVTVSGILAGIVFYLYFRRGPGRPASSMSVPSRFENETPVESAVISNRLNVSPVRQRQIVGVMQVVLVGIFAYGLWTRQLPFLVNAAVALAITFVPAALERDYGIPIEPGLALWMTSAVFLHALGSAGLYDLIPSWDTLTHTLSATVVAAAGYTILRAIHLHARRIHLPTWAMFTLTIVFVLAMGVVWELLEFLVDRSALALGLEPVLAQHGINDTMSDLLFDGLGAVVVAIWGTVYLVGVSERLATRLENWSNG